MIYFLLLTNKCNLRCKYCFEKAFDDFDVDFPEEIEELDNEIKFDTKDLYNLIANDPKPYIIFYGGEPTLRIDFIRKVVEDLKNTKTKYIIQTNGLLLKYIGNKYLKKFDSIFVSIDGCKKITNANRGENTYEKVIDSLQFIRKKGYKKEVTARMVILNQNIYDEVTYLFKNKDFNFDSVHWQIDANFWFNDYKKRNFKNWLEMNYKPNLKKLVEFWYSNMKKGKVLKIYPFIGIMQNILDNTKTKLMCGAGYGNYAIQTNGKIIPCPIMAGMKNYYLGDIKKPILREIYIIPPRCKCCNYFDLCGGRCLYSNIVMPWPEDQVNLVCKSTKYLIDLLKQKEEAIKKLINNNIIRRKDFDYLKYNGAEIIP